MNNSKTDCLIIDDDPEICTILKIYCERLGHFRNIIVSNDGLSGCNMLRNQKFGLVLLDINIPKKSGLEVLTELKLGRVNSVSDVVVISGEIDINKVTTFMSEGVKRFITKPFLEAQFKEKVLPVLEKNLKDK
ncbi:response regulator [Halobacteriovorax sp.]|uniref:response regulator n=1 Tax=Halobacteriovorax sp. TaxID=2020862 RepID=UPI003564A5CA